MIQKNLINKHGIAVCIVICFFSVALFSCVKTMTPDELNFEYKDYLVVDGMITTEKKEHKIVLSHTIDFAGVDTPRMETGAKVSVTNGDTTVNLTEKTTGEYVTAPDFSGVVDKTYTLNILPMAGNTAPHAI
jgi:hypothetical protein